MAQLIGGPGLNLPPPQALYPANLLNTPPTFANNEVTLAAGQALPLPAGWTWVTLGAITVLQWFDPVTLTWRGLTSGRGQPQRVWSDGINVRVANLTGCPVGAIVVNTGAAYPATGTTVTASGTGGSTWVPVIGGSVNATVSVSAAGSGYGVPPLVLVPAPPAPGVPATMHATIASGTVSSIIVDNRGAGYGTTAPPITILPSPYDPNFIAGSAITNAAATCTVGLAGQVTAVLCTDPGASLSGAIAPTLTVAGTGGASASVVAVMMATATGTSIVGGGAGYGAVSGLTSFGGMPTATPSIANPAIQYTDYTTFIPRPYVGALTMNGTTISVAGTIYDPGLFLGTPSPAILGNISGGTVASITFTLGGTTDLVIVQPA